MPRNLTYHGRKHAFENLASFVAMVKARYPSITPEGINQIVARNVASREARSPSRMVQLLGADIMTADLTTIPAWPFLGPQTQRDIASYPHDTGERVDELDAKSQVRLVTGLVKEKINRSALISPRGLQQTYVWSDATQWTQEVTDADYDLILRQRSLAAVLRDPERAGGVYVEIRPYDVPVTTVHPFNDMMEASRFHDDMTSSPHFAGIDLGPTHQE